MRGTFLAIAMAGFAAAAPGFAMDDMSCADFTAMDAARQSETLAMMAEGDMGATGAMASGTMMAPEDTAMAVGEACAEHPDMMLGEAVDGAMTHE